MTHLRKNLLQALFTLILLVGMSKAAGSPPAASASAQEETLEWTRPELLFSSHGDILNPVLLADKIGRLHMIWQVAQTDLGAQNATSTLFYSQKNGKWSLPSDIIAAPVASNHTAAIDSTGKIHLIWFGEGGQYYYSQASVETATSIRSWTKPVPVASGFGTGSLVVDEQDHLHFVYPGADASGVFYTVSEDDGITWSLPDRVTPTLYSQSTADQTRLAFDSRGTMHVVWTEYTYPQGFPPTGVFYTKSSDGGRTWTDSLMIARTGYDQGNLVIDKDDRLHLAYNGMAGIHGRYYLQSQDGGETWSEVTTLTDEGGTEGFPQLVLDSAFGLYILTTHMGCPWLYSKTSAEEWNEPACLTDYETVFPWMVPTNYIEEASMTITSGNLLHAVFWDGRKRLWYLSATIPGAPQTAPQHYNTATALPHPSPTPVTATPQPNPTPTRLPLPTGQPTELQVNVINRFLFSIIPVFGVMAAVIIFIWARNKRY